MMNSVYGSEMLVGYRSKPLPGRGDTNVWIVPVVREIVEVNLLYGGHLLPVDGDCSEADNCQDGLWDELHEFSVVATASTMAKPLSIVHTSKLTSNHLILGNRDHRVGELDEVSPQIHRLLLGGLGE